ncbi:MAG: hypothetical protein J6563_06100 [Gilliamella sp.]|uniref:hypothetical protein n=1 Tax=unclassified Gilliamella TaxID=2685620 RepID=UPI00080DAF09|nr:MULTISPECIES: hypothetical protein [Gilliamella]MCO6552525.1 hypothetical protein [Gilliamella sp.]MCO6561381.1 hypothetical protein [Gilliamella sp.]OCG34679.1 hypothetical protein A9G31_09655 [Gilliamella apicola]OCG66752.1 hypothetical protein A9G39_05635 [Gilliamella apicola]
MTMINYWQKLSKRLPIKIAFPHLLLGVIATVFSLCQHDALPTESSVSQIEIIAIASIVQDHQEIDRKKSQTLPQLQKQCIVALFIRPNYIELSPSKVIRLSPYNGIRAGPIATA